MPFHIRGTGGAIHWGWHAVATLQSWAVEGRALTATGVVVTNTFGVSQSPLTLVCGSIRRPITGLQIAGETLTASLVPKESHAEMPFRAT